MSNHSPASVVSPASQVPVVHEADVIVAGAGIAGIFAALSSARHGARTVLIDRYGSVGGNYGPGLGTRHDMWQHPSLESAGLGGVVGEFFAKLEAAGGLTAFAFTGGGDNRKWSWDGMHQLPTIDIDRFQHLMLSELLNSGVTLVLSTQVSGAVMDGATIRGVFVEARAGRQALLAPTVVDTSGEADVAAFAGAPCDTSNSSGASGIGLFFRVKDVDWERYEQFRAAERDRPLQPDETQFLEQVMFAELGREWSNYPRELLPFIMQAWTSGEYQYVQDAAGLTKIYLIPFGTHNREVTTVESVGPGARQSSSASANGVDSLSVISRSALEAHFRRYIYESVEFYKRYVPGFEAVAVEQIAPYMGSRRGRTVIAEHTLTDEDIFGGGKFEDVVHRFTSLRHRDGSLVDLQEGEEGPAYEVPLRSLLAQRVEGLLAAGRAVNTNTRSIFRNRWAVMITGGVVGVAAALSAESGAAPRKLSIHELQSRLQADGYHLGDSARLAELGLA